MIIAKTLKPISAVNEAIIFSLIPPNVYWHSDLCSRYVAMIEGSGLPESRTGNRSHDREANMHDGRLLLQEVAAIGFQKRLVSPGSRGRKDWALRSHRGVGLRGMGGSTSSRDLVHAMWKTPTPQSRLVAADIPATSIMFCCLDSDAGGQRLRVGTPEDEFRVRV